MTWALEKTAYYTLGCEKLLVLVDHKPLMGLLTTRNLGDIENPRLLHLAERLLRWKFQLQHIAGAKNFAPDALSRSPSQAPQGRGDITRSRASSCPDFVGHTTAQSNISIKDQDQSDDLEAQILATTANSKILLTSWADLQLAGISDPEYSALLSVVNSNTDIKSWPPEIKDYKQYKADMSSVNGVVLYKGRVVVPTVLRHHILQALH